MFVFQTMPQLKERKITEKYKNLSRKLDNKLKS